MEIHHARRARFGSDRYPRRCCSIRFTRSRHVPSPGVAGEAPVPEILGVPASGMASSRITQDEILGRCLGRVIDGVEAMRTVTHLIDPIVPEERIVAACGKPASPLRDGTRSKSRAAYSAVWIRSRSAGIRTALVSDAGADDVESWQRSPLRDRFDAVVFSYRLGVGSRMRGLSARARTRLIRAPADAIFVGDGGSDEHRGAREVGMKAVLVTRLAALRPETLAVRRARVTGNLPGRASVRDRARPVTIRMSSG